jgi:hypothetical protein
MKYFLLLCCFYSSFLSAQEEAFIIYYKNINSEWIRETGYDTKEIYDEKNRLITEINNGNFLSTKSQNTYNNQNQLVKKRIYSSSNQSASIFEYFYNHQNLLETEVNKAMNMKFKYSYDNQNQLIKKEFYNSSNELEEIFYYSYQLDSNKEKTIVEMRYNPKMNQTSHIISKYNALNLLISESRIGSIKKENNGFKSAYFQSEYIYKYDAKNRWVVKTCIVNHIPVSEFHKTYKKIN